MYDYTRFRHLTVDVEEGLAIVRLSPAPTLDFEDSFYTDVRDMFVPLGRDPDVSAVVVTNFGALPPPDAAEQITQATLEQRVGRFLSIQQFSAQLVTFRTPIVAAITGPTQGVGAQLALLSDAVIASESATFYDEHVQIGLAAGDGGTMLFPMLVGVGLARQILLEGRALSAAEAHRFGLVSRVVPEDRVLDTASELARRLSKLPRVAYMATKLAINNWFRLSALLSWDIAAAYEVAGVSEPAFTAYASGTDG